MELNNLQKNVIPYSDEYYYISNIEIKKQINPVEAVMFFIFYFFKDGGISKMMSDFLKDVESKVLNKCKNRQLTKVEYEDYKVTYGNFYSKFKYYYSKSLNGERENFQEHKNWILNTILTEIKKSNNIIEKYSLIQDFKSGLFETLEFIHLIGGYEKILKEKETEEKTKLRELEVIERKRQEKIELEELGKVLLEKQKQEEVLLDKQNQKIEYIILEKLDNIITKVVPSEKELKINLDDEKDVLQIFKGFFNNDTLSDKLFVALNDFGVINSDLNFIDKDKTFFSMFIIAIDEMKFCENLENKRSKLLEAGKELFKVKVTYSHYNNCRDVFLDKSRIMSKSQKKHLNYFKSIFKDINMNKTDA